MLIMNDSESLAIGIRNNKVITVPFDEVPKFEKRFDKKLYDIAQILSL